MKINELLCFGAATFILLMGMFSASPAKATDIRIINIAEDVRGTSLGINDKKQLVWRAEGDIYLYSDGDIKQITDSEMSDYEPELNNSGQIVWRGGIANADWGTKNICLYSNGNIIQITDDDDDATNSHINNNGIIVYRSGADGQIYTYNISSRSHTQITDNSVTNINQNSPQEINSLNQVCWVRIYLVNWPGSSTDMKLDNSHITNDEEEHSNSYIGDGNPDLNDNGAIVWERDSDGDGDDIILYKGNRSTITNNLEYCAGCTNITKNSDDCENCDNDDPKINNRDQIVWSGQDGNDYEIYLYSNGVVTQITDNKYDDDYPAINDSGQITWRGRDENENFGLFLYSNGTTSQITHDIYDMEGPLINANGTIAWTHKENKSGDWGIYLTDESSKQCIPLDANLNFSVPCMDLSGTQFGITWKFHKVGMWIPDLTSFSYTQKSASCIAFDSNFNFFLPCMEYENLRLKVNFNYDNMGAWGLGAYTIIE